MPHRLRTPAHILTAFATAILSGCAGTGRTLSPTPVPDVPYAIYDVGAGGYLTLAELADALTPADVVFFGEYHDDGVAHDLELELFGRLGERRGPIVLGLEMFERDVQAVLDRYLAGEIGEEEFLAESRPWGNYATDYRPLVEHARTRRWPVLGTNLPQSLASAIARGGLAALDDLPPDERTLAARENECGAGPYWERFIEAMTENADSSGHVAASEDPMFRRMFEAQCARDEAMAETLADALVPGRMAFHVNGAFHSDFRLGVVSRLLRRREGLDVRVVSAIAVDDIRQPPLAEHVDRGDYLIFTPEP